MTNEMLHSGSSPQADATTRCSSSFEFKPQAITPSIYELLAEHQVRESWDCKDLVSRLHLWATRFNEEFDLGVSQITLGVDRLSCYRLGHFRPGHNGFGLEAEIVINRRYIAKREAWQVLGTLLHELLHGWQQAYGKPGRGNYHNAQLRNKARSLGLIVDPRGYTEYEPESPFTALLTKYEVDLPGIEHSTPQKEQPLRGSSKLKKWTCGCTNVRVAVADFHAQCLKCGRLFYLADSDGAGSVPGLSIKRRLH